MSINIDNTDDKQINIGNEDGGAESVLNINYNDDALIGVDLLANVSKKSEDNSNDTSGGGGYTSGGEESIKSDKSNKEDFNFFSDKPADSSSGEEKNIKVDIQDVPPIDDPMLNNMSNMSNNNSNSNNDFRSIHSMTPNEIKNEKIDILYKFRKLEGQGIRTTMNYNMNSNLEDMRSEYYKLKKQRETDNSIKFQRKILMAAVTGAEFLNNKFDPFDIKLDGWSESVNDNINDFDEIFEELAEKYTGKSDMAPELKLVMAIGGSAFMFHLTQTLFKSSMPGMGDIMQQNPDLMKQFAQAAVGSMANNVREPPPMQPNIPRQQPQPQPQQPSSRPDMDGPAGLDDLINQMNLQPDSIPDLDSISLMSGNSGNSKGGGLTLNL